MQTVETTCQLTHPLLLDGIYAQHVPTPVKGPLVVSLPAAHVLATAKSTIYVPFSVRPCEQVNAQHMCISVSIAKSSCLHVQGAMDFVLLGRGDFLVTFLDAAEEELLGPCPSDAKTLTGLALSLQAVLEQGECASCAIAKALTTSIYWLRLAYHMLSCALGVMQAACMAAVCIVMHKKIVNRADVGLSTFPLSDTGLLANMP